MQEHKLRPVEILRLTLPEIVLYCEANDGDKPSRGLQINSAEERDEYTTWIRSLSSKDLFDLAMSGEL